jgi:hypothetical protein
MAIKKPHLRPPPGQIASRVKDVQIDENPSLLLSFKLLDLFGNRKFSPVHCKEGYLQKLLERLRDLGMTSLKSFRAGGDALRSHQILFERTSEPDGFVSLNSQLRDSEAWQCQISVNQHGRLHGILIDEVFYVIWIDPCHLLYSSDAWCDSHPHPQPR